MPEEDFRELTGEDPEDIFGGDWKNTLEYYLDEENDD